MYRQFGETDKNKQLSWDCLDLLPEQNIGSDGMQRKQLSWNFLASDLEQNGSFYHVSERPSRSLQDMSDVLHDLKTIMLDLLFNLKLSGPSLKVKCENVPGK
jgi:hypothetical protein